MKTSATVSPDLLVQAYLHACELELQALKPGNVHVYAEGHGMGVQDFRTSALVSAAALTEPTLALGERMLIAVTATREAVACNTNLGIVLLAGPLLAAAQARRPGEGLRRAVARVLEHTTRKDADCAYRAIRMAAPAGLGVAPEQDVNGAPDVDLRQAMIQAAHRDRIALQYRSVFPDVFEFALPRLRDLQLRWNDPTWAVAGVYMELLARHPDTHVARKYGAEIAASLCHKVRPLAEDFTGAREPAAFTDRLMELDRKFKCAGINPGTTADLTVATVLAGVLEELLSSGPGDGLGISLCSGQLSECCEL